jgi:hypothetical protein
VVKVALFSTKPYDQQFLQAANAVHGRERVFFEPRLTEEEAGLFFEDVSTRIIQDDVFARLLTFPNVLISGHQGSFTREALQNIAETTLANITAFEQGVPCAHSVT